MFRIIILCTEGVLHIIEGVDFIGPKPSILTFTAGQIVGDIQCTAVIIVDDSVFSGQRSFRVRLVNMTSSDYGGDVQVYADFGMPALDIKIAVDADDGKWFN